MGKGAVIAIPNKQKINAKSSTEVEIVGVDDASDIHKWTRLYVDKQCRQAGKEDRRPDKPHQDDTSAIRLETNGKASSSMRIRHVDARHFTITDRVKAGWGTTSADQVLPNQGDACGLLHKAIARSAVQEV